MLIKIIFVLIHQTFSLKYDFEMDENKNYYESDLPKLGLELIDDIEIASHIQKAFEQKKIEFFRN